MLGETLVELRGSAGELADELRATSQRHAADHAVYHVGRLLASRMGSFAMSLDPFLEAYGHTPPDAAGTSSDLAEKVRRTASTLVGRSKGSGQMLLSDLRDLMIRASACEVDWTIARQGALAARDEPLMRAVTAGLEETKRVQRWLRTRIKETAPQVLMSAG